MIEPRYLIRLRKRLEKLRAYLVKEFPQEKDFAIFDDSPRQRVGFHSGFFIQEIDRFLRVWRHQPRNK